MEIIIYTNILITLHGFIIMIGVSAIVLIYNYTRATITLNNYKIFQLLQKKITVSIEWIFFAKKKNSSKSLSEKYKPKKA